MDRKESGKQEKGVTMRVVREMKEDKAGQVCAGLSSITIISITTELFVWLLQLLNITIYITVIIGFF